MRGALRPRGRAIVGTATSEFTKSPLPASFFSRDSDGDRQVGLKLPAGPGTEFPNDFGRAASFLSHLHQQQPLSP